MKEYWKDIPGYEGLYQVSNYCRVKNIKRNKHLRLSKSHKGYLTCILYKNNERYTKQTHRLGMETFVPDHPGKDQVNHKDEDKTNNFIWVNPDGSVDLEKSNLEWCDAKYNINYGTGKRRSANSRINHPKKSTPVICYTLDGVYVEEYPSETEAQRRTGVHQSNIYKCCMGIRNNAGPFVWKYKEKEAI